MPFKSINKQIKGGHIYIKTFPRAKSTQFNHYVLPTLEDANTIHDGMNDILRSKDSNDLNDLLENVIKIAKICQNRNIGKIFISGKIPLTQSNIDVSSLKKIKNTRIVQKK